MQSYISLLRGINVSGQKKIRMADLRVMYEGLGFSHVETYVQSGNVVFQTDKVDPAALTQRIENQIEQVFGFIVTVIIRQRDEWLRIVENNPFLVDNVDPSKLYVTFLSDTVTSSILNEFSPPQGIEDAFVIREKEIYLHCLNGYGRTKINNTYFEKKLGVIATTRNWKSVNSLARMIFSKIF